MSFERDYLEEQIRDAELRHRKSLEQIAEVDKQIKELEVFYRRASSCHKNASRYNLRLRISVVNGLRMMLHHYSSSKQEEISRLRSQLFGRGLGGELRTEQSL